MAKFGNFLRQCVATYPLTEQLVQFQRITISLQELDTTIDVWVPSHILGRLVVIETLSHRINSAAQSFFKVDLHPTKEIANKPSPLSIAWYLLERVLPLSGRLVEPGSPHWKFDTRGSGLLSEP